MSLVSELKGPTRGFIACFESKPVDICWGPANELSDINFSSLSFQLFLSYSQILLSVIVLLCIILLQYYMTVNQVNCLIFGRQDEIATSPLYTNNFKT